MLQIVRILSTILVAFGMAPAVAHTLEHPGKMRLGKDAYLAVQSVYYPGFTIAGAVGETGGLLATIVLLLLTPSGSAAFPLTLVAVLGMAGMQLIYWVLIHPVNRVWLRNSKLGAAGGGFFAFDPAGRSAGAPGGDDWRALRDRWERSHIARSGLAFLSFLALLFSLVAAS